MKRPSAIDGDKSGNRKKEVAHSEMTKELDPALVSEALPLWVSWGRSPYPKRDDGAVLNAYGAELGHRLLKAIRMLEADYYTSEAGQQLDDLAQVADRASSEFRQRDPEVLDAAVQAL